MFKFVELLCEKDFKIWTEFYRQMEGKKVYFPKTKSASKQYFIRRNDSIRRMYRRLGKLDLTDLEAFSEISIRLRCAYGLSITTIRHICKCYSGYNPNRERR